MHYRTSNGIEVDFIAQDRQGRVVGIEVKSSTQASANDFKGLRPERDISRDMVGEQFYRGVVLHPGKSPLRLTYNWPQFRWGRCGLQRFEHLLQMHEHF